MKKEQVVNLGGASLFVSVWSGVGGFHDVPWLFLGLPSCGGRVSFAQNTIPSLSFRAIISKKNLENVRVSIHGAFNFCSYFSFFERGNK